jgi:uncharacterized protein YbaR (Trm112 family)
MRKQLLNSLCCPFDKSDLSHTVVTTDLEGRILEGYLHCNMCNRIYPIVSGIPIMNPDEYREFQYEQPLYQRWSKYLKGRKVKNFCLTPIDDAQSPKFLE